MKHEQVSARQTMFMITMFNFGSSVIMGVSTGVGQEGWIPVLLAAALFVPVIFMYARILRLFPEKDLFEIAKILFGRIFGKVFTALFLWYAIHLCALVLRNFSEFTHISSLPETPQLPIMILMILTTVYLARSGVRSLGKWSVVTFFLVSSVVLFTSVMAAPKLTLDTLLPIFEHTPAQFAESTFQVFSFPYAESVVFLCLAGAFPKKDSPYKTFFHAHIIILIIFLLVYLRNLTLLGLAMTQSSYFPSYLAVRIIEIGNYFSRIEGSISSNFILAGIVKITVCLLAASKGVASLFNLRDYRPIVLPMGMFALALCAIVARDAMEMFAFIKYYPYYAFLFQVILPMAVWVAGEIHARRHKRRALAPEA